MVPNNPAYRLLNLITELKKHEGTTNTRKALKATFGVVPRSSSDNDAYLHMKVGKMIELVDEIVGAHEKIWPNRTSVNAHWSKCITTAFERINFGEQLHGFLNVIDGHSITQLEACAMALESKGSHDSIDEARLAEWRKTLNELLNQVVDSDASMHVKQKLSRILRKLIEAIDEYKISGVDTLLDSLAFTFGALLIDEDTSVYLKDNPEVTSKFKTVLETIANITSIVSSAPAIGDAVAPALNYISSRFN